MACASLFLSLKKHRVSTASCKHNRTLKTGHCSRSVKINQISPGFHVKDPFRLSSAYKLRNTLNFHLFPRSRGKTHLCGLPKQALSGCPGLVPVGRDARKQNVENSFCEVISCANVHTPAKISTFLRQTGSKDWFNCCVDVGLKMAGSIASRCCDVVESPHSESMQELCRAFCRLRTNFPLGS